MYVDVERDELYRFVSWQRTYDRWQFHVMGFWNPRLLAIAQTASSTSPNAMAGKGLQIMTVFNHGTAAPTPR
jgi:hypothetical protein